MHTGGIEYIAISPEYIRRLIRESGLTLKAVSDKLNVSRMTMYTWLKEGRMNKACYDKLVAMLISSKGHRTIWMRIGVTVLVTDDELFDLMERAYDGLHSSGRGYRLNDVDLEEEEAKKYLKRARADGEAYVPEVCFDEHIDWWLEERKKRKGE